MPGENAIVAVKVPEGIRVSITEGKFGVMFDFVAFVSVKGVSRGKLIVRPIVQGKELSPLELMVSTADSREGYVRQIKAAYGSSLPDLTLGLSAAFGAFREAQQTEEASKVIILDDVEAVPFRHVLYPFLEKNLPNMCYARGGTGKTTLAYRMAMSVVSGLEMFGSTPEAEDVGDVLVMDYENGPEMSALIMRKVACDMPGVTREMRRRIHYVSLLLPVSEVAAQMAEVVRRHDVKLLLIDSASGAAGATDDQPLVQMLFHAIRQLGTTSLIIGHVAKADTNLATPIGSIYWENFSRNTYSIEAHEKKSPTTQVMLWKHRKRNSGPLVPDIYYSMIAGETGVTFTKLEEVKKPSATKVIEELLIEHDKLSRAQMRKLSDLTVEEVRKATNRLRDNGKIKTKDKGETWSLI